MLEPSTDAKMSDNQMLGRRLREARVRQELSLRELARRLKVSPATMSAVESGHTGITAIRLARVAEILETPVADFLPADVNATAHTGGTKPRSRLTEVSTAQASETQKPTDWRTYQTLTLAPPLQAALAAFLEFGYHGATVRDIAQRAGLSVPGVYHYYPSKQHMLVAVLDLTMDDLSARTAAARAEGPDPVERFRLLVECLALFHTHRRELGFVGASEMRSLAPPERARIAAARGALQQKVDKEVKDACKEGSFHVAQPHEASRAVVNMCTALPNRHGGQDGSTAEEIATQYVNFALDLMRYVPHAASRRERRG